MPLLPAPDDGWMKPLLTYALPVFTKRWPAWTVALPVVTERLSRTVSEPLIVEAPLTRSAPFRISKAVAFAAVYQFVGLSPLDASSSTSVFAPSNRRPALRTPVFRKRTAGLNPAPPISMCRPCTRRRLVIASTLSNAASLRKKPADVMPSSRSASTPEPAPST